MASAKAKTINLLLDDGTLNGVISIADSSWNKGELYSAPREAIDELISSDACNRYGVYLLLSEDMVYVGQASDLSKRIKQHIVGKAWWERVIILTTSDDSLNRSDIDYIEASLIQKAEKIGRLDCDNKNSGNKQKVTKFRQVELEQYLDEALFLLQLIGVNVFCEISKQTKRKEKSELLSVIQNSSDEQRAIREKREAIVFLKESGVDILANVNYASRQPNKEEFWINPSVKALEKDWSLVLNNQYTCEIIVLHIPAGSFAMRTKDSDGLFARHDQPQKIDLNIRADTVADTRSKKSFASFVTHRIKY